MSGGFERGSTEAECRATVNAEIRHIWRDIGLLWEHNKKRREEYEAVTARINGAILAVASLFGALLFGVIRAKIGL